MRDNSLIDRAKPVLLLAEDNALIRRLLAASLDDDAFTIVAVARGEQAIEAVLQRSPAVAVLDIYMPGKTGIEICRTIRETPATRNCVVIMLTGSSEAEDRALALAAGANSYLTKPFSPAQLRTLVHNALSGHRSAGYESNDVYSSGSPQPSSSSGEEADK